MEVLKGFLGSGGINILTDECVTVYLDDFDILNLDCAKATVSKALGLAIIAGSIGVKLPQIMSILKAKSAEGLSFTSVAMELLPCATMIAYSYANGFPFSAWGDSLFMALQTMVIAFLILSYGGQSSMGILFCSAYASLLFFLTQGFLSIDTLGLLQMSNVPILVVSRLIQAMTNYKNKHTGMMSLVTTVLMFLGGLARIFTSIQETNDPIMIINFSSGAFMSFILLCQFGLYAENTKKLTKKD